MPKPSTPLSIRLDAETEQRLRRLAHESGATVSAVVREAVAEYGAARERDPKTTATPFDRLAHLIGAIDGQVDRSERTGQALRSALRDRSRARRAR